MWTKSRTNCKRCVVVASCLVPASGVRVTAKMWRLFVGCCRFFGGGRCCTNKQVNDRLRKELERLKVENRKLARAAGEAAIADDLADTSDTAVLVKQIKSLKASSFGCSVSCVLTQRFSR